MSPTQSVTPQETSTKSQSSSTHNFTLFTTQYINITTNLTTLSYDTTTFNSTTFNSTTFNSTTLNSANSTRGRIHVKTGTPPIGPGEDVYKPPYVLIFGLLAFFLISIIVIIVIVCIVKRKRNPMDSLKEKKQFDSPTPEDVITMINESAPSVDERCVQTDPVKCEDKSTRTDSWLELSEVSPNKKKKKHSPPKTPLSPLKASSSQVMMTASQPNMPASTHKKKHSPSKTTASKSSKLPIKRLHGKNSVVPTAKILTPSQNSQDKEDTKKNKRDTHTKTKNNTNSN